MKNQLFQLTVCCLLLLLCACAPSRGGKKLDDDNLLFVNAIARTMVDEALINIVRLRYQDWPSFSEIKEIQLSQVWEGRTRIGAEFARPDSNNNPDKYLPFFSFLYRLTPKVLYQPLTGETYTRAILSPARLGTIFSLIKTGFAADDLLINFAHSVNGYNNTTLDGNIGYAASPVFFEFARVMRTLQLQHALEIDTDNNAGDDEETITMRLRTENLTRTSADAWSKLKQKLELGNPQETYRIKYAISSIDPGIIALRTRSILGFANSLAIHVDIPEQHLKKQIVKTIQWQNGEAPQDRYARPLQIKSARKAPDEADAYAIVPYRNHWYWVEDTDPRSKASIQNLLFLMHVTESGKDFNTQFVVPIN